MLRCGAGERKSGVSVGAPGAPPQGAIMGRSWGDRGEIVGRWLYSPYSLVPPGSAPEEVDGRGPDLRGDRGPVSQPREPHAGAPWGPGVGLASLRVLRLRGAILTPYTPFSSNPGV